MCGGEVPAFGACCYGNDTCGLATDEWCASHAGVFLDSQDLVFQFGLTHVKQGLSGHGRIPDYHFIRHKRQDRVHQVGLA